MRTEYALTLDTAPSTEPVSNAEMDLHLRLTGDAESADSDLVDSVIKAARQYCETFTGRAFITQTWKMYLDSFPSIIYVPRPPLSSVSSITYVDTDGVTQTLSSGTYTVDTDNEPGRIYLAYNQSWPDVRSIRKTITITFVAGYGAASSVPETIKAAIKLLAAHLYENRESVVIGTIASKVPDGVNALLWSERVYEVA